MEDPFFIVNLYEMDVHKSLNSYICYAKKLTIVCICNRLRKGNIKISGNEKVTIMVKSGKKINCPVTASIELIGGKWKTIILYSLLSGTRRFGEIAVRIPDISRKVLTEQLKELESDGLILREQYKEIPPRVEYSLTELGKSLSPVFRELEIWGTENLLSKE